MQCWQINVKYYCSRNIIECATRNKCWFMDDELSDCNSLTSVMNCYFGSRGIHALMVGQCKMSVVSFSLAPQSLTNR